jgi:peptide deformylase
VSLLGIRVLGDPVLRQDTNPVTQFDDALRTLVADMFETMYAAEGIGLAATQVGRLERVAVLDVKGAKHVVVNPEVVMAEGEERSEEGCLSIPEIYGDTRSITCTASCSSTTSATSSVVRRFHSGRKSATSIRATCA